MSHANIALFVPHAGCPHNCSFCNQKKISGQVKPLTPEDVLAAAERAAQCGTDRLSTELAFFGGSFTAIERGYMVSLLESAKEARERYCSFSGIRISTRPDAIDGEILSLLSSYGVTAIELGAQSTDENVLKLNERGHTYGDIVNASHLIRSGGFSLGLQMMTGLYGSTPQLDEKTARDIIALKPDTVRIYPTIVIEGTRLAELYRAGVYTPETTEDAARLSGKLLIMFNNAGIRVIRLGLHSGGGVEDGYVAGPYHPAFGELCESEIYLQNALGKLMTLGKGRYTVNVNPKELSKMTGQKKSNITRLAALGYDCAVKGDESLGIYETKFTKR